MISSIASSSSYPQSSQAQLTAGTAGGGRQLSAEEQRQVEKLAATDRKVRAHEQAHMSAGGGLVRGGASFGFQTGPDGKRYAISGEVSIDVSPGKTPAETIAKARQIYAAAAAPADPSAQDRSVAAQASRMEMEARAELASQPSGSTAGGQNQKAALASYLSVAGRSTSLGFRASA